MLPDPTLQPQRLSTHELFRQGNTRLHVNHPIHEGTVPLHDHDFFELALVLDGAARHTDLSGQRMATAGLAVWLPPGHWHGWQDCQGLKLLNVCLSAELLNHELSWTIDDAQLAHWWALTEVRYWQFSPALFQKPIALCHALREQQDRNHPLAIGLLLQLLSEISGHIPADDRRLSPDPLVRTLRLAMRRRLDHDWSLNELADLVNKEASYTGRRFRRATGKSPIQWLAQQRCEQAALALLATDDAVADIGARFGWSDANYFARIFRKHFDLSPSAYRRQRRQRDGTIDQRRCSDEHWLQW